MLDDAVVLLPVVLLVGLAIGLHRLLARLIRHRSMSVGLAAVLYCVPLAIAPSPLAWLAGQLGRYLIATVSSPESVSHQNMGLAMGLGFGWLLNCVLALIAAIFACWRFVVLGRARPDARAT